MRFQVDSQALTISWSGRSQICRIGKGGAVAADRKAEGDGATPLGEWQMRWVMYRPDRLPPPRTGLAVHAIGEGDLWCDDPAHPAYNRWVGAPFDASHENLMRDDIAYDLLVVLGHNDSPPVPGLGSAVFLHLDRPDHRSTLGCVAVEPDVMIELLRDARPGSVLEIR